MEIPRGGVLKSQNFQRKVSMNQNWNFHRDKGEGVQNNKKKTFCERGMDIFLESGNFLVKSSIPLVLRRKVHDI